MTNLDEQATVKRVKKFLKNDYWQLKLLADAPTLQSVSYDRPKVTASRNNYIEELATKRIDAQNKLALVNYAISCLGEVERTVLDAKIIKKLANWQVEELTGYGSSKVYQLQKSACLNFAKTLAMISDIDLVIK
ncbi:hypothetical protein H5991_04710 [Ligilactobacillus agilis]|uniref:ArpU family phage packaging/lysis transcriptional regulator n=1 Tax=Ligilactobacillus agilis TaxID=1601 RepID=UPI00195BA934|nr:ArpU family phage packaging/lysis transcriptional regulator [Ligilactobacillus agilis]MBM6772801.1 hypothetical protein [Ligilactobacillus agilis]